MLTPGSVTALKFDISRNIKVRNATIALLSTLPVRHASASFYFGCTMIYLKAPQMLYQPPSSFEPVPGFTGGKYEK